MCVLVGETTRKKEYVYPVCTVVHRHRHSHHHHHPYFKNKIYIVCFKTLISSIFYKYKNTRTYVVLHIKYTNLQTIVQRHTHIIIFFYHHQFIHTQLMRSLCVLPYVPWSTIFSSIFRSFLSSNSHAFLFRLFNNSLFLSLFRFFCIFLSFLFNSTRQIV